MAVWRVTCSGELYGIERWANVHHINVGAGFDPDAAATLFANAYNVNATGGGLRWLYGSPGDVSARVKGVHMSKISLQALVDPAPPHEVAVDFKGGQNTAGGLPVDVALCISWATGRAGRSYRGRTYLPPQHENQNDDSTGSMPKMLQTTITGYAINASFLLGALDDDSTPLVVYSRKLGTFEPITGGYINDEWDTQRRRSKSQPATRTSFVL